MNSNWSFEKAVPILIHALEERLGNRAQAECYVEILQLFRTYVSVQLPSLVAMPTTHPDLLDLKHDVENGFGQIERLIAAAKMHP